MSHETIKISKEYYDNRNNKAMKAVRKSNNNIGFRQVN